MKWKEGSKEIEKSKKHNNFTWRKQDSSPSRTLSSLVKMCITPGLSHWLAKRIGGQIKSNSDVPLLKIQVWVKMIGCTSSLITWSLHLRTWGRRVEQNSCCSKMMDEKWWMKTDKLQSKSQHIIIFTNSTVVVWNLLRRESIPVSLGTQSILGKVAMQHFAKVWQCTTNKCSESGCWIQWREDERLSRESQVCSRASSVAHAFCSDGVTELYVNKYYICFWFIY